MNTTNTLSFFPLSNSTTKLTRSIILLIFMVMNTTIPVKAMDDQMRITIGVAGIVLIGTVYTLHKFSSNRFGTIQHIFKRLFSSFFSQKAEVLRENIVDKLDIPHINYHSLLDYNEWFRKTDQIDQRRFIETVNGTIFSEWVSGEEDSPWKKNHQSACAMVQSCTALPFNTVQTIIASYVQFCINSSLLHDNAWVDQKTPLSEDFFSRTTSIKHKFLPFIQALKVEPNSKLYLLGDRHGDIRSTMHTLRELQNNGVMSADNGFKIENKNHYLVVLGDYTDRGVAGIEVLITMLMLKLTNPHNVILIRGNHEDESLFMNQRQFQQELEYKFPDEFRKDQITLQSGKTMISPYLNKTSKSNLEHITKIYEFMPVALFIGSGNNEETNYLLASHAGIDMRYNPKKLYSVLQAKPNNTVVYELYPECPRCQHIDEGQLATIPWKPEDLQKSHFKNSSKNIQSVDFVQSYTIEKDKTTLYECEDTFRYGKPVVNALLADWTNTHSPSFIAKVFNKKKNHTSSVIAVIRGHQHFYSESSINSSPLMKNLKTLHGFTSSWNDENKEVTTLPYRKPTIYTVQQAPDNPSIPPSYNLTYDTCIEVTTKATTEDWGVVTINVEVLS